VVSKIDEYRARAVSCERRAKKTRDEVDREWQMTLAHAFLMLAEAEAERDCLNVIRFDRRAALGNPAVSTNNTDLIVGRAGSSSKKD
jgi:hypothetical protein